MIDTGLPKVDIAKTFFQGYPDIAIVIAAWVDIAGVVRSRITSPQRLMEILERDIGFNQSPIDMVMNTMSSFPAAILEHFSERSKIMPDPSSLRPLPPSAEGLHNTAMVWTESCLWDMDARRNLGRVVEKAKATQNLEFLIGFELEFYLLKKGGQTPFDVAGPDDKGHYLQSVAHRSEIWPVLNEIVTSLSDARIIAEQVSKESGSSQWEVSLPPLSPVESVDTYLHTMETIKTIANRHGMLATFFVTPFACKDTEGKDASNPASGQHIHLSATKGADDGSSDGASWDPDEALAGILSHLPALTAVGLSQIDSYRRVGKGTMAVGSFVGWGDGNRDMPIRRIKKNHWEIRCHDAASNPYAMTAGLISAALDTKPLTLGNVTSKLINTLYAYQTK